MIGNLVDTGGVRSVMTRTVEELLAALGAKLASDISIEPVSASVGSDPKAVGRETARKAREKKTACSARSAKADIGVTHPEARALIDAGAKDLCGDVP